MWSCKKRIGSRSWGSENCEAAWQVLEFESWCTELLIRWFLLITGVATLYVHYITVHCVTLRFVTLHYIALLIIWCTDLNEWIVIGWSLLGHIEFLVHWIVDLLRSLLREREREWDVDSECYMFVKTPQLLMTKAPKERIWKNHMRLGTGRCTKAKN